MNMSTNISNKNRTATATTAAAASNKSSIPDANNKYNIIASNSNIAVKNNSTTTKTTTMNINNYNREAISMNNSSTSPNSVTKNKKGGQNNTNNNSNSPNNNSIPAVIPLVRSRTAPSSPQLLQQTTKTTPPRRERCNSGSHQPHDDDDGGENNNNLQWETMTSPSSTRQQHDPDNQEQALFEQRLCEDIYGVAVRKINQNGKSNLRYVKCLYVDASEIPTTNANTLNNNEDSNTTTTPSHHFSSSRSVSSRHSRGSRGGGFSRFLSGGRDRDSGGGGGGGAPFSNPAGFDTDVHRSLLRGSNGNINNNNTQNNNNNNNANVNGKIRVLSWGKKKDVTVPLDQFTAVRKGKVTNRSRRNPCPASRIVSLIATTEIHAVHSSSGGSNINNNSNSGSYPSLDIEAPTRLDRDKFARAFARFLNIPLLEEGDTATTTTTTTGVVNKPKHIRSSSSSSFPQQLQYQQLQLQSTDRSIRSNKSDMSPHSWKDSRNVASSVTNSIPDIAVTTTNSHTTINSSSSRPLPVVTTRGVAGTTAAHSNSKPPRNNRRSTSNASGGAGGGNPLTTSTVLLPSSLPSPTHQLINSKNNNRSSRSNGADSEAQSDPPLISLQSSSCGGGSNTHNNNTNTSFGGGIQQKDQQQPKLISTTQKEKMVLEIPTITKMTSNAAPTTSNTPATSATAAHVHTHSTHNTNNGEKDDNDDDVGSIVSSITGAGFDQDLVEELHLALERMKVELEDSRAEASRAVKVAEQAIQSAENSNSKDWNNTVTHKAAEAAATAQKRSAEAMAKARIAEERLQIERKAAAGRKKQVEKAEQQAAHWQTRAAAAEIQRFAVAEALESERKKNMELLEAASANNDNNNKNKKQQDAFDPFDTDDTPSSNKSKSLTTSTITTPVTISQMTVVEVDRLRSKLAMESARRRKLLDELQDLRGAIRVYCRPRAPATSSSTKKYQPTIDMVSNEVLMLHRDRSSLSSLHTSDTATSSHSSKAVSSSSDSTPLCFEFDGILSSDMSQNDVYAEFEAICASVVEGYKVCIMTYGQADSGKTHTMLGEVHCNKKDHSVSIDNHGVHLRSMKQLFSLLEHRRDRFLDTVTLNLVEVHDERLIDLLAGTDFGEAHGRVEGSRKSSSSNSISSSRPKLEIKTNRDGETVLRGVLSVEVSSFEDVLCVWNEILAIRSNRLAEQDIDARAYELDSHVLATLKVSSINIVTGASASGQIQFVDFASSDVVSTKRSLGVSSSKRLPTNSSSDQLLEDWKFTNKSLNAVRDVVQARTQYQRSVPYRNSTITHVLSDSLEADTKVVMIACVSTDEKDVQNTTCTLQFAQEMRKVIVGKATRHTSIGKT